MRVTERFPAAGFFEGERELLLRRVPAGARLRSARLTLLPLAAGGTVGPAVQAIVFTGALGQDIEAPGRPTGIVKSTGSGVGGAWVEVAFPGRRMPIRVLGSNLAGARLQVDFGGTFVEINAVGAVRAGPDDSPFVLAAGAADLPRLLVSRFRLSRLDLVPPDVSSLDLLTAPSNLTVAVGGDPPAWARPGELTAPATTAELADSLAAALAEAPVEGGFALLPLRVTSDSPARLAVIAELELDEMAAVLPPDLEQAKLGFGYAGYAGAGGDELLRLRVPAGRRLRAEGTGGHVQGGFEASEIVLGPLAEREPAGQAAIAAGQALAQPFVVAETLDLASLDLLLSTDAPRARLQLDLRGDLDGKPDGASLLAAPATAEVTAAEARSPTWINSPLSDGLRLAPGHYWLVAQSLEGRARWSVAAAAPEARRPQASRDGGLSWRLAAAEDGATGIAALFRLRRRTESFKVPLEIEIGRGAEAERIGLADRSPLGRIDFALDGAAIAAAANRVLERRRAEACPRGEQLANGEFADRELPEGQQSFVPAGWSASGGEVRPLSSFGGIAAAQRELLAIGQVTAEDPERAVSLSQVVPVSGGCPYELVFRGFSFSEEPRIELIWRGEGCGVAGVERLAPHRTTGTVETDSTHAAVSVFGHQALPLAPAAILRTRAPEAASQAEVRLLAPAGSALLFDRVTFEAGPPASRNPDLLAFERGEREGIPELRFAGWTLEPEEARIGPLDDLQPSFQSGALTLRHGGVRAETLVLSQQLEATPGAAFAAVFLGRSATQPEGASPRLAVEWQDAAGAPLGEPLAVALPPGGGERVELRGEVPKAAATGTLALAFPPGSTLQVEAATLTLEPVEEIAVAFLAEAPGELTVRRFAAAFEAVASPPLPEPETGLCEPTPANRLPGEVCECRPCGKRPAAASAAARAGRLAETVLRRTVEAVVPLRLELPAAELVRLAAGPPGRSAAAAMIPLQEISGIGPAREKALFELGIRSVADLAEARPEVLVRRLGYHETLVADFLRQAEALVAGAR